MNALEREADRLSSLRSYGVPEGADGLGLDGLAMAAARACGAQAGNVHVVDADRVHVVGASGPHGADLEREGTFCAWVVEQQAPLVVPDAFLDERFTTRRASRMRAYAGVPLLGRDGLALGTLCVVDERPRAFTEEHLQILTALAQSAVAALELRRLDLISGRPMAMLKDSPPSPQRLRRALDAGEMLPWFQPVIELQTGRPRWLEALMRWEHPTRGLISTAEFLPFIESSGLALPFGRTALHQSLRVLADLRSVGACADDVGVSVNVFAMQLATPGLAASILKDLEAHDVRPEDLCIEVTEHGVLAHRATAVQELTTLREAGVQVALDDFGTGEAGLRHLLDLPITILKLDGSLISGLGHDPRVTAVIRSTLELAEALGVVVIAEGVERREQWDRLRDLGCRFGQGHAFSPAVRPAELPSYLLPDGAAAPTRTAPHELLVTQTDDDHVEKALAVLLPALQAGHRTALLVSTRSRVLLEGALASSGVDVVSLTNYRVHDLAQLIDAPALAEQLLADLAAPGAVVWSELAGALWARGDTAAARRIEDVCRMLPGAVHCGYPSWALARHGTPEQVRRLSEQHSGAAVPEQRPGGLAVLTPEARRLVEALLAEGASHYSVAAALNAQGHASPWSARWHWRQVDRLLAGAELALGA